MIALYSELRSPTTVADELGIPRETVRSILKRAGVLRPREDYRAGPRFVSVHERRSELQEERYRQGEPRPKISGNPFL